MGEPVTVGFLLILGGVVLGLVVASIIVIRILSAIAEGFRH